MIEEKPGSGIYWLDGWPSGWGIQHSGSKETGDYVVTAVDPPGGPFVNIGFEVTTHSGRRVRVTKIADGWSQIFFFTEPA